jgi:hypothetical protein
MLHQILRKLWNSSQSEACWQHSKALSVPKSSYRLQHSFMLLVYDVNIWSVVAIDMIIQRIFFKLCNVPNGSIHCKVSDITNEVFFLCTKRKNTIIPNGNRNDESVSNFADAMDIRHLERPWWRIETNITTEFKDIVCVVLRTRLNQCVGLNLRSYESGNA